MPIDALGGAVRDRTGMTDPRGAGTGDAAFGARLRAAREAARLSQEQLAAKIDRSQNTISDYETGSVMPEAKDVPRLARAVGAEVGFLLEGTSTGMANEVEKLLRSIPRRTWRRIGKMTPQEIEQVARDLDALVGARPPAAPPKRRRR